MTAQRIKKDERKKMKNLFAENQPILQEKVTKKNEMENATTDLITHSSQGFPN